MTRSSEKRSSINSHGGKIEAREVEVEQEKVDFLAREVKINRSLYTH